MNAIFFHHLFCKICKMHITLAAFLFIKVFKQYIFISTLGHQCDCALHSVVFCQSGDKL